VFPVHWPQAADDGTVWCSCGAGDCADVAKHPRTAHGFGDASTDPAQILNWWGRWPAANIGVATGERSGLVVLDVDLDKGGYRAFMALLEDLGRPTLLSLVQGTGGGGFHVLYRWPGHRVGNSAKWLRDRYGPGLDVRGDGGYIVAAPSLHRSGRRYAWQTGAVGPLSLWPATLDDLVQPPARPAAPAPLEVLDDHRRARTDLDYYWRMILKRRLADLDAVRSNRNDALFEAAARMGQVVAIGADEEAIHGYLLEAGRILSARGDHPMPDRELEKTIRSGLAKGRQNPDRWFGQGGRPA
jgi:hypothetical protein